MSKSREQRITELNHKLILTGQPLATYDSKKVKKSIYNGEMVAGSLMVPESRKIANLMLKAPSEDVWKNLIITENILQKRSMDTAKRQARLIRNRLRLMTPEHWKMVKDGSAELASQALLAAAIKHSRLLGDFMDQVVREHHRTFKLQISRKDWREYLDLCKNVDPSVEDWTENTQRKLGQVVIRILAEAKYIDNTKSMKLLSVMVVPELRNYLIENNEKYVLRCMEVNQN